MQRHDTYVLCTMPQEIATELALHSGNSKQKYDTTTLQHLYLSQYTLSKQEKHPEVPIVLENDRSFVDMVESLMSDGECIRELRDQYQHHLLFFLPIELFPKCIDSSQHKGKFVKLVLKITTNLDCIYLQSIHLVDKDRYVFEKQRGKTVFASPKVVSNSNLTYRD